MTRSAALALALLALPALAASQTLEYTVPSLSQRWYRILDDAGDSVTVTDCSGPGEEIHALDKAFLFYWPSTAGGRPTAPADSHSVAGMQGLRDSFPQRGPGLYWVEITNFLLDGKMGRSCESNPVRVLPGVLTDVPVSPADSAVSDCRLFTAAGAHVSTLPDVAWYVRPITPEQLDGWAHRRLASGIYFLRCTACFGERLNRKVAVVR